MSIVKKHGLAWPQICQGEGTKGSIARLYHLTGTPTYYVLNRDGTIAGKSTSKEGLGELITSALSPSASATQRLPAGEPDSRDD